VGAPVSRSRGLDSLVDAGQTGGVVSSRTRRSQEGSSARPSQSQPAAAVDIQVAIHWRLSAPQFRRASSERLSLSHISHVLHVTRALADGRPHRSVSKISPVRISGRLMPKLRHCRTGLFMTAGHRRPATRSGRRGRSPRRYYSENWPEPRRRHADTGCSAGAGLRAGGGDRHRLRTCIQACVRGSERRGGVQGRKAQSRHNTMRL